MLIWSTWGPVIRWLALPPVIVLFSTSLIASVTVPVVLAIRGEFSLDGVWKTRTLFLLLAAASFVNNISYFYALGCTTVSNAVFTHYTAPVFVAVLAPILISERIRRDTLISLPLALAGMGVIVYANGGMSLESGHTRGILAGTLSGVAYAFIIVFSRQLSRMQMHNKAVVLMPWITVIACAPAIFLFPFELSLRTIAILLATGIFHSTLAPLLYYDALRSVLAQHAAILGYLEPVAAIPIAWIALAEAPAAGALAGGITILISGYLVVRAGRPRNS
jgi:drug/metabolite transporter (DMT)-like permease